MNDIIAKAAAKATDTAADSDAEVVEADEETSVPMLNAAEGEQLTLSVATAESSEVPATEVMFDSENAEDSEVSVKKATRRSSRAKSAGSSKSKMFDTLTFREV